MGTGLLEMYRQRVKKEWKQAFISAMLIGLCIHLYKFTNTLPNHDSIYNYYSDQNVIGSGRWLLSLACGISSYFDLPWINGLFSLVFIALTAAMVTEVLEIHNPVLIALSSGLLVAFPGITETFFFEFTADGYMLAMLLAALAVACSRVDRLSVKNCMAAGICICCACAIYQAYVSFALVLALIYFILGMLEERFSAAETRKWIAAQIAIYVGGLVMYYALWKVLMRIEGYTANSYQGIDTLAFSFSTILHAIPNTLRTILFLIVEWNPLEHGWSLYAKLNVVFLLCGTIAVVYAVVKTRLYEKKVNLILTVLSLIAIPFVVCLWLFASEGVMYRPMMMLSFCLLYIFIGILFEKYFPMKAKNLFAALLMVIVLNNGIMANISYYYMNRMYFATLAEATEMMGRIHQLDTDTKEIAVIGKKPIDLTLYNDKAQKIHMLGQLIEPSLLFDELHLIKYINETFYESYSGVDSEWSLEEVHAQPIEEMDCWPRKDSIQVIDDVIVIKLEEADHA